MSMTEPIETIERLEQSCPPESSTIPNATPNWEVLQGDSLLVLPTLKPNYYGALFTDPPYCSGGRTAGEKAKSPSDKYCSGGASGARPDFEGDSRDQRSYLAWSMLWMLQAYRLLKPQAIIGVFTDWRQLPVTTDALQAAGFTWYGTVVWDKTGSCRPAMDRYANQVEYLIWGAKGKLPRRRAGDIGALPGVYHYPVKQSDKFHLTGKPTGLLVELLKIVAPGEPVLDCFGGSMTTGVGALRRGCPFTGIEMSEYYANIGRGRLEAEAPGAEPFVMPGPPAPAPRSPMTRKHSVSA